MKASLLRADSDLDYYITTINNKQSIITNEKAAEDCGQSKTTTVILSVDRRGSKLRKRKKSKRRKKRNTLGGVGSNSDNESKFNISLRKRKCTRRAISLNERDLMRRSDFSLHRQSLLFQRAETSGETSSIKNSLSMKKDEKKIVSKEILKSEDTNQVKRRGEKGRKTSSKRRNRVGGMLITSGDFNNLVAMEALPSSPQKDSPAFVKNDLKKTPVLSQSMSKQSSLALLDLHISDIESRVKRKKEENVVKELGRLHRSSPCLVSSYPKESKINFFSSNISTESKEANDEAFNKFISKPDFGLIRLKQTYKFLEKLSSVVDENESLKVRVRDLQNELQQTKLLLIHSDSKKSKLTLKHFSKISSRPYSRDDMEILLASKKSKITKHKKVAITKSDAEKTPLPIRVTHLKKEAHSETTHQQIDSVDCSYDGDNSEKQASSSASVSVRSSPGVTKKDPYKQITDKTLSTQRSSSKESFYKKTGRLFSWAGSSDSWRSKSVEGVTKSSMTRSNPAVNNIPASHRNPVEWTALQESFPTSVSTNESIQKSSVQPRSTGNLFKARKWFSSKRSTSQGNQLLLYLPQPDVSFDYQSASSLASQQSFELNEDEVQEITSPFTEIVNVGNEKRHVCSTSRQNSNSQLTSVKESEITSELADNSDSEAPSSSQFSDEKELRAKPPKDSSDPSKDQVDLSKDSAATSKIRKKSWKRSYSYGLTDKIENDQNIPHYFGSELLHVSSLISPRINTITKLSTSSLQRHQSRSTKMQSSASIESLNQIKSSKSSPVWKKIWNAKNRKKIMKTASVESTSSSKSAEDVTKSSGYSVFTYGLVNKLSRQFSRRSESASDKRKPSTEDLKVVRSVADTKKLFEQQMNSTCLSARLSTSCSDLLDDKRKNSNNSNNANLYPVIFRANNRCYNHTDKLKLFLKNMNQMMKMTSTDDNIVRSLRASRASTF